jgi:hypothetical protein
MSRITSNLTPQYRTQKKMFGQIGSFAKPSTSLEIQEESLLNKLLI